MLLKRIILVLFLILPWAVLSSAQQITVSLPDTAVDAGSQIEIPVHVNELDETDGVVAGEWEFTTSSGMVSLVDADATDYLLEGYNLNFNPTTGRVAFASTDSLSESGTLLMLTVQVREDAEQFEESDIGFRNARFNEGDPEITTDSGTVRIRGISINPQSPQNPVVEGTTFQFDLDGDAVAPVTWSTSDETIAQIDSNGLLTAQAPGSIRVYAEDDSGLADSTNLFRIEPETLLDLTLSVGDETITQTLEGTVTISVTDLSGLDIQSGQFEVTFPSDKVEILSFDTGETILEGAEPTTYVDGDLISVAFADSEAFTGSGDLLKINVQIPRNASGTADFTPQNILFNESIEADAESGTITIEDAPVPEIEPLRAELTIGDTEQFSVISGGTAPYTWNSSDSEVASVDPSTGELEALSRGVTNITATDADNFSSEEAEVIVNDITMTLADYSMADGGTVSVPLDVMDISGLGIFSYEVEVEYDPSVVEFDELEAAGTLSDGITTSAAAEDGVVTIAGAAASPLSGEGSLVDVIFKRSESPGSEQETDLVLKRVQFNESGPDAPTATRINGSIAVEGVSWTGDGDGSSWDDPDNWSSQAVPDSESEILIGLETGTSYAITIDGSQTVNSIFLSSEDAELVINDSLSVGSTFIQSGGSVGGPGSLATEGLYTWSAGTLGGSGTLFPLGGILVEENGIKQLSERTILLRDEQEITFTGTNFSGSNSGFIDVGETAVINLAQESSGSLFEAGTGGALLRNAGDINRTEGTASTITFEWDIENSGSITQNLENAELQFTGNLSDDNGTYHAANGSIEFNSGGTYNFSGGSSLTSGQNGTIRFGTSGADSNVEILGTYDVQGTTTVRSSGEELATLIISADADLVSLGEQAVVLGGSRGDLQLQTDEAVTIGTLELNEGGSLSLSSQLTVLNDYIQSHESSFIESDFNIIVEGDLTWSGGTMAGDASTIVNGDMSIDGNGDSDIKTLDSRTLELTSGAATYRGDHLFGLNGAAFQIGADAELNLSPLNEETTMSIAEGSDADPRLLNGGLVNSTQNNNVFNVDWMMENEGSIDLGDNQLVIETADTLYNSGSLGGSGNIIGHVKNHNGGFIMPGSDTEVGQLQFFGSLTQDGQSEVKFKIGGTSAGSTYDQLRVDNLFAGGTLSVELINDFSPAEDDVFQALVWPGGSREGDFTSAEGLEVGDLTLAIRYQEEQLEIYDGSFTASPGSASISVSVNTPPFQRIGRSVPIDATISNTGEASMQRIRVENFTYGVPSTPGVDCPTNDAYENLKCRMERYGVTLPPPEEGSDEEYPFLPTQRFPAAIGGGDNGSGGSDGSEFTSVTDGGGSFGISSSEQCENEPVNPTVKAGPPVTDNDLNKCAYDIAKLALDFVPGAACFKLGAGITTSIGEGIHGGQFNLIDYMGANMVGAINCAGDAVPATKAIKVMKKLNDLASKANGIKDVSEACSSAAGEGGAVSASGSSQTTCIGSYDPNDKVGPIGVRDQRYIASGDSLPYVVFFENLDDATAAAQKVIISDTLDTEITDFESFSFGMIAWSDTSVSMEADVHSTSKDVDLRPEHDLILRIEADLEETTGVINWQFTSLDPETMEPTPDPLAGFLPPNKESPEGEGLVSYFVSLNEDTPSNTEFGNSARIIFDENDPIDTPVWSNTLDTEAPESSVQSLDSLQTETEFTVSWSGDDDASGIEQYTIYVSEDGGDFSEWIEETDETSAEFTGEDGKTYEFFSRATDWTGNTEDLKDEADAVTSVELSTSTEPIPGIPERYVLNQNYPNPFNPSTTIRYGLPESGDVELDVYNMAGKRVATLVKEHKSAGWHEVTFNASNMASGVYIYRIQSGEFIQTRKLILVK